MTSRDEYVRRMHSKLDQLNNEINNLAARKEQMGERARTEFAKHVNELRGRRDAAHGRLKNLRQASGSAWGDMKTGVVMAWEAIGQAIESARSRFKRENVADK